MKKLLKIVMGCMIVTVGLILLRHANIVTGGTAGLSISISYLTDLPFSWIFFIINLPFYIFSFYQMGFKFTMLTILSISLLSLLSGLDSLLPAFSIPSLLGAILGGAIIGFGVSILFMNQASLGGANILALFMQKKYNWNPGKVNFVFDFCVVLTGLYSIGLIKGLYSVVSIAVLSIVIAYFKNNIASKNFKVPASVSVQREVSAN
ncbi:YitT family protein [Niallia sp. NCCP-28]|uniref:YitT family protein n=1 Tax=Niallia sp. NCCP-28 TaxID=2934712 RepID=UPI002085363E|nr:YitT family protein [Niallia sp. NCCP-28]GKU81913.1 membrane protein [Niallia sp. NCCP-28]